MTHDGVVGSVCILRRQNDWITSFPTLAVVIGLEITSFFIEPQFVEKIMIEVGCVEKLSKRCVSVCVGVAVVKRETIFELELGARWLIQISRFTGKVLHGYTVVALRRGIVALAVRVPGELGSLRVPRVCNDLALPTDRIIYAPWA